MIPIDELALSTLGTERMSRRKILRMADAMLRGRRPGQGGRPITSTHPRAAYWREYKRRNYQPRCKETQP